MSDLEDINLIELKEINERFNNGTETMEDITNYCRNYEIEFENGFKIQVVEKKYFDKLVKRIKELEDENKRKSVEIICYQEELENSIPVQKVKDLIENETINISGFECIAVEDLQEVLEEK